MYNEQELLTLPEHLGYASFVLFLMLDLVFSAKGKR
jgi:hypothetical protein